MGAFTTINYGSDSLLYDSSTGTYMDSGGNVLSASDVSAYGAPTGVSQGIALGGGAQPGASTSPNPGGAPTSGATSGMSSIFATILGAASGIGSTLNPPKTVNNVPMVYSAAAGGYIPASAAGSAVGNLSMTPIILVVGGIALLLIAYYAFSK